MRCCRVWRLWRTEESTNQHTRASKEHNIRAPHKKRFMEIYTRHHRSHRGWVSVRCMERSGARRAAPVYRFFRISRVYLHKSLFVWRACVVLFCVPRVCEAMEAASARPGSAPPGKPPAKRLGKQARSFAGLTQRQITFKP